MKYIFSYRRGQDRTLLVDPVQNNNVKNKKKMHLSELTGEWSAISTRLLSTTFPLDCLRLLNKLFRVLLFSWGCF